MSGLMPPGPLSYEGQVVVSYINRPFDPTTSNYQFDVPTIWTNTASRRAFILVGKPQNVADWVLFAGGSGSAETVNGNSGGPVSPDATGNLNAVGTGSITSVGTPSTHTLTVEITGTTNHSLLVGAGTPTLTNLGVATNGQIPIGSNASDPVLATLTAGANISITNGAGSITIAADTSSQTAAYTAVAQGASPYTVLSTDYYLGCDVTGGVITINLPNAPATGRVFAVKDKVGLSATSNITVTTVGGIVDIDGATTYAIKTNYSAIQLIFNGTSYEVY